MTTFEYRGQNAQTAEPKEGKIKAASLNKALRFLRSEKQIDVALIMKVKKRKIFGDN
jgi:hypothetical protein